jgi:uncharacterized membrane protein
MHNEVWKMQANERSRQILGFILLLAAVLSAFNILMLLFAKAESTDLTSLIAKTVQFFGFGLMFLGLGLSLFDQSKTGNSLAQSFQKNRALRIMTWVGIVLLIVAIMFRFLYSLLLLGDA